MSAQTGNQVRKVRSDRGGEYLNQGLSTFLVANNIVHELTSPYSPEQNKVAERENHMLVDCVRAMLHAKGLSLR